MTTTVAGGSALASNRRRPDRDIGGRGGKGESKGREKSKQYEGGREGPPAPEDPLPGVCRFHLKGKCRAGRSCSLAHNPPCRFVNTKGVARGGKNACSYTFALRR